MDICGIQKNGTGEPIYRAGVDTDVESRHGHTGKRREWGELEDWTCRMYTATCKTDS